MVTRLSLLMWVWDQVVTLAHFIEGMGVVSDLSKACLFKNPLPPLWNQDASKVIVWSTCKQLYKHQPGFIHSH